MIEENKIKEAVERLLKDEDFAIVIKKLLIDDVIDLTMQGLEYEAIKQLDSRFFIKHELFDKLGISFDEFKNKVLK